MDSLNQIVIYSCLPGCAGGITAFLFAIKKGHYRNNKYFSKFSVEIIGALLTALFLSMHVTSLTNRTILAFALGVAWSGVIQIIRTKITKIVEAILGESLERRSG